MMIFHKNLLISFLVIHLPLCICQTTPSAFSPKAYSNAEVIYDGTFLVSTPGTEVPLADSADEPELLVPSVASAGHEYILFMLDIDGLETDGSSTITLHWYQPYLEISGSDFIVSNTSAPAAAYASPAPPAGGSAHRYVLFYYQQPAVYEFPSQYDYILPLTNDARWGFDLNAFADAAGLTKPIAGTYWTIQNYG